MKVLVTGYGPFLDHKENPSLKVAQEMGNYDFIDYQELPVEFSQLDKALKKLEIKEKNYDFIFLLGLAASRKKVTPEMVALNWCYCPGRPDNEGKVFEQGELLIQEGEKAIFSSLDVEGLSQHLNNLGIHSEVSFTAGTYVCNATYYKVLFHLRDSQAKCCFIHIPPDVEVKKLALGLYKYIAEYKRKEPIR